MRSLVYRPTKEKQVRFQVPLSKSVLNRELILQAHAQALPALEQSTEWPDDSQLLLRALNTRDNIIDVGHAGTAMRFLCAYFSSRPGEVILTGSERMHQRPIKILVDALKELGAKIDYLEKEGFPPLRIEGKELKGGSIQISGEISSQYISALLLSACKFSEGISLELTGQVTSRPYIGLTLAALKGAGIPFSLDGNTIRVESCKVPSFNLSEEKDWSAAAYGYGMVALGLCEELIVPGLDVKTWQGDSILGAIFAELGIQTGQSEEGVHLIKKKDAPATFSRDMSDCPDLAQPIAFTCAALGISCELYGLHTLKLKETDRIVAMSECLSIAGIKAEHGLDFISFQGKIKANEPLHFRTYEDHRMAMGLSLWAAVIGPMHLEDPHVVSKSFPGYWNEAAKLGLELECPSEPIF